MTNQALAKAVPPPLGYHVPTMRSQLGNRIRTLRLHNLLYRKTLAKLLGCSEHMVRRIESGKTMPRIDLLLEISNVFRVSINYLVSDADEPYPIYDPMQNFSDGNTRWR